MKRFFDQIVTWQSEHAQTDRYAEVTTSIGTPLGPEITVQNYHDVLSFNTLQYLGDLSVPEMMRDHLNQFGQALACSPLILQTEAMHEFENAISVFKGFAPGSCLMLNSGYLAARSITEFLISQNLMVVGDDFLRNRPSAIIFIDAFTHISIQRPLMLLRKDAGPQQKIRTVVYRHLDYADLEEKMQKYADIDADKVIVTDTVFSMHGDAVDMRTIYNLAMQYGAYIFLDTAHSDGVYGKNGRGFLFLDGLEDLDRSIFLEVGTLSKVFACGLGGYIILPQPEIVRFARKSMEAYVFAAGLPPFIAAAARNVIDVISGPHGDAMRQHLHSLSAYTLHKLKEMEFDTLNATTHIIPIRVGDEVCQKMHDRLLQKGISVGKVYFPAVEKGQAILRIILTALHTEEHVYKLLRALKESRDEVS